MTPDMRSSDRWRRAWITIDERALAHNLGKVREYAPHTQVMAVIKADAYGHGMLRAAQVLQAADLFAVAMVGEACSLRQSGCMKPVVVLHGYSSAEELETFSKLGLSPVIHQQSQLSLLLNSRLSQPIDVWLKIDTGMHRLGIDLDEVNAVFGQLRNSSNVKNVFVMSHFAKADEVGDPLNNRQLESFIKVTNDIDADRSMANSAAIMRLPSARFEVVRPGIMLYGSSPFDAITADELGLEAVMQFESSLLDIKKIKAGETIGYGGTYRCSDDMRVGIVAAGYGDGYPRHAGNRANVWINGKYCSLLGRVSMDSLCVDLSNVAADIGDRVVLWGKELSVDEVARNSSTISYELLCHAGSISGNHPR